MNTFVKAIALDLNIHLNFDDDLVKGCCINHAGAIVHERLLNI